MLAFDIVGWIGSFLVVLAYLLLSTKKIKPGLNYQLLNLLAAILMAIGLFPRDAWFSFALQIAWGLIAIFAIIRMKKHSRKRQKSRLV